MKQICLETVVTLSVTEKFTVKLIHAYVSQCPIVLLITLFYCNSLFMNHIYRFTKSIYKKKFSQGY